MISMSLRQRLRTRHLHFTSNSLRANSWGFFKGKPRHSLGGTIALGGIPAKGAGQVDHFLVASPWVSDKPLAKTTSTRRRLTSFAVGYTSLTPLVSRARRLHLCQGAFEFIQHERNGSRWLSERGSGSARRRKRSYISCSTRLQLLVRADKAAGLTQPNCREGGDERLIGALPSPPETIAKEVETVRAPHDPV